MQRAWALNSNSSPPTMPASLELGYPKDTGPATTPGAWWFHMVTEEMLACVAQAGLSANAGTLTQLRDSIAVIARQAVSSGAANPVRMVDSVGVPLSFAQVVDGVAVATGDRILRSVSPADPANGLYIANTAGAWTRATDFPSGGTMLEGMLFSIAEGSTHGETIWQMVPVSGGVATIGTTPILFSNTTSSLDSRFALYLLASSAAATYAPLTAPSFGGAVTLSSYTAGSVPYLNASKILVSDGALTFDGTNFATTGVAAAGSFNPTSAIIPAAGAYLPAINTLGWATNSIRRASINSQGYFAVGAVSGIYQAQVTGAGQSGAAIADGGAVGSGLLLQDTNAVAGAGGALVFGVALGGASPFAAIKGLLSDTSTGKVGHLALAVRTQVTDLTLSEVARLTNTRNVLVGTNVDALSASSGNLVTSGKQYGAQQIGIGAGTAGQLQAIGGASTTWYNAFLRNDGTTAQLLSSAAQTTVVGAVDVAPSAYRPFSWNLSTGAVTIDATGVGVVFGGVVSGVTPASSDNSNKYATTAYVATKLALVRPTYVNVGNNGQTLNPGVYLADTSAGAFSVLLPAAPALGDLLEFTDAMATFGTNNLTILRNGNTIRGNMEDLICNVTGEDFRIWFTGSDWRLL